MVGWVWAGVGVVILPKKHLCQTSSFVFCTRSTDRISNNYSRDVCILMHNQYSHVGKKQHISIRKEALSWIWDDLQSQKINMEPEHHPFGKVHHLQKLHFLGFWPLINFRFFLLGSSKKSTCDKKLTCCAVRRREMAQSTELRKPHIFTSACPMRSNKN